MQIWAAERDGAVEKPDQPNGFHKGKGKSEMNVFSEKSADPMWKLVRKGTAPAFAPQNLRSAHVALTLPPLRKQLHSDCADLTRACQSSRACINEPIH